MKHSIAKGLVSFTFIFGCLGLLAATTTTKTVTWELPADWDAEVSYPLVQGYCAIVGDELLSRTDIGAIADPDLPYYRIRVALPSNATFGQATCDIEWEKVDLGGALPLPIAQPVPTSSEVTYPAPGPAYATVYPSENVKVEFLQIMNDVRMMPITVTPFRWDGPTKQLYKAKKLKVTATYTVPATRLRLSTSSVGGRGATRPTDFQKMALSMTINPEDGVPGATGGLKLSTSSARQSIAYFGDDNEADYVIISPHEFIDLWKAFAEFRKTTANGASHTFCVTDTRTIYAQYDNVDGDDALKIHRYIEDLYKISPRKIKYVLLGAAAKKYQYDRETMIPARYIVCSGSLCQMLDMYYGCMDRMPVGVGVEVWDYDGDGAYLGHKNANGTYSQDSNAYIDWQQDLAVFRFPMMKEVVESGTKLTAPEIMTNFIKKVKHLESEDYPDRYSAIYTGSTGFSTSTYGSVGRGEMYGLIIDEREFFDQGLNIFSPEHPSWASDSEYVPRDHGWEFLTYLRGNRKVLMNNSSYNTCSYADIYRTSGEFLDTVCHGWARGAVGAVSANEVFTSTGYYTIFDCAVPCDTGMYDYCPGGSYGITNTICVGEAPALAPHGGGLASINNTRYGWSATCATSYNNGNGNHSFRLSWLFLRALTGVKSWSESKTYQPMNAGEALMWAHNMHGTPYATAAWGLSGAEVTGQGDPLARLSLQYERTWNPEGDSHDWSTNAANWEVEREGGGGERGVFDVSRNVYLPLTDKGSETFCISNTFTTAGFFVKQDADATLTLKGEGSFKSLRETVITNGNVRWEVAGGVGRDGIKFVGNARGNIELPGNAKRYFGECFSNVGTISISGGNVVIDTPRNFNYGKSGLDISGKIDWSEIEFVAARPEDVTEYNQLRSRTPGIFKTNPEKHLRVVNSKLSLQTYNLGGTGSGNKDKPLLFVTNSTIKVQANPLWKEEYFVRPTYLDNSTIIGDYDKFAFGPADGTTGYDLYVSGKCAISGDKPIKLNGELRIHFVGADAELEIANAMRDGTKPGTVSFFGSGKVKISATQTFTTPLVIPNGVTLEGAIAKLSTGAITIQSGATANFTLIPLQGVQTLTLAKDAAVNLPGETGNGIYQVVDSAVTTLIDNGAKFYDVSSGTAEPIVGDISEGYLLKTANILFWKGTSGTWDKTSNANWTNASGVASVYTDNVPLCFANEAGDVAVTLATDVAPGFMDFRNHTSSYTFGGNYAISVNSLAIGTGVTFDAPLKLANTLKVTGGRTEVTNIETPSVEVANGGTLRVKGEMTVPTQKIKKLKFSFAATKDSGNVAAIQELRLFNKNGFFRLPKDTIITDIANQQVTITGPKDEYGHTMTGHTGDEQLGALVDGKLGGNNKWWASNKKSPTWFEITFPSEVDAITGYDFYTADSAGRNPKAWSIYTAAADKEYALSATKSDVVDGTAHHWMIGDGTASGALYPLINVNGFTEVKTGGTLVLDGELYANVSLEANAILAIEAKNCLTNKQPQLAKLTLPESGTVTIDLSAATPSIDPFPIMVGYNLTNEQLDRFVCSTEEGMLVIKGGDLYAATQSEKPPYRATVTTSGNWSGLTWYNADNQQFNWNTANRRPNGEVRLTINSASTISVDVSGNIGRLVITGSAKGTFVKTGTGDFTPAAIDDSGHTGTLDWQLPTGSAAVTAGSDTCIRSGEEGRGLLTVNAGKKVTLGTDVTFANRAIDADGWVRFEGTRTDFELAGYDPSNYSFTNGFLTGSFVLDRHTIRSRANDYVKLIGSEANYYARSLLNVDIEDGTVEIETNGDNTWFGRTGTPSNEGGAATVFNQSGGTFRCLATGTGAGGGLLTGYEGGTDAGYEFYLNLTGNANFEVPSSYLNFGNPTIVTLLGNAHMKAKGYIASMSPGTINLGTNSTDSVVMEVGALGLNSGAANITMYKNSAIVGYEDGAFIEGGITLRAKGRSTTGDTMTIAAANDTTLTLRNLLFSLYTMEGALSPYNGNETVLFNGATYGGTIKVASGSCLPKTWKLMGGNMEFGDIRVAPGSTLSAAPSNGGKISFVLTDDEYESGMAIELIKTSGWSDNNSSDTLKTYFKVQVDNGSGLVDVEGTLESTGGIVSYIPKGGASEYVYPLTATVDGSKNWTALTWTDRNGKTYNGTWENVTAAQLVNKAGNYTVTMNTPVSLRSLRTQVSANRTLTIADNGDNKLTIDTRFDDSGSAGTTKPQFSLDGEFQVLAGKQLWLNCANSGSVHHGKLIIGGGCVAQIYDGAWNGPVEMADSTSSIQYRRTASQEYTEIPGAIGPSNPGKTEYYIPLTPANGLARFGSDTTRAAEGNFYFQSGTSINTTRFLTGIGNGTVQKFFQRSGSIVITGDQGAESAEPSFVLGNDSGSDTKYYMMGGSLESANAPVILGLGGTAELTLYYSSVLKGVITVGDAKNSTFTMTYKPTLELGSDGIHIRSSIHNKDARYYAFNIEGKIVSNCDTEIEVPDGIGAYSADFAPAADTVMTVNAPIYPAYQFGGKMLVTGAGRVDLNGMCYFAGATTLNAGTLRLGSRGLLGNSPVVFGGGKIEVQLTLAEVRAKVGNNYALFQTALSAEDVQQYTTVRVKETGSTVSGVWTKSGNTIMFKPSDNGDITAEIAADGTHEWTTLGWRDAQGPVDPTVWESVVGNVLLTNAFNSTVTLSKNITLATLRLYNSGTLTISGPLTADGIDDSRSTGQTTIHSESTIGTVKAGKDTILESSGSGTLTIESGKKATSKVAYQGGISNTGTYVYDYPVTSLDAFTDNRQYAGGGTVAGGASYNGSKTLRLVKGDYTYGGRFAIVTATADVSGDTTKVTVPTFVMGDGSNANSTFNLSGGTFEVTGSGTPTSTSASILLAHWSSTVNMNVKGGTFIATNAAVRLGWDGTANVSLGTDTTPATMRVKGIKSGSERNNAASFTLGANGTLELGDFGLQALGTAATYNLNGGRVIAFADSLVKATTVDKIAINGPVTFAAETGKTLTVNADFAGTGCITCGESGKGGTILFLNGTYADSPITGTFTIRMTQAQQTSGAAVTLCKTPDTTVVENVTVQLADGNKAPGTVKVEGGNLVWTPPECTMPLRATVTGEKAWAQLTWYDSSATPQEIPTSFWPLLKDLALDVTVTEGAVLTMPTSTQKVSDDLLTVNGTGTIVVDNLWPTYKGLTDSAKWQGTLRVKNKTGCAGLNFVYLGNSASTVEVNNVSGWFEQADVTDANPYGVIYPYALKVVGSGLTINNGSSYKGFAFENVTGDGPINFGNSGGDPRIRLVLKNVATYTGTLTVLGKGGVTLGSPTARISDGTIVFYDGCVAPGKTWTAPNGVTVIGKLTVTPDEVKPFNCALTFNANSALNVAQDEDDCESVPLTTGTLTMNLTQTTLTFNNVAKKGEWTVAAGYIVKTVEIAATTEGFVMDARHNDKIIKATGLTGGHIAVNSALSPVSFTTKAGDPVVLKFADGGNLSLAGGLTATEAKVVLDASALNGTNLAKCAVRGAPYSCWLIKGAVSGTVEVKELPTMPTGYRVESQVLANYGVRLMVRAPNEAMFEAVSLNLYKDAAMAASEVTSGIYPVTRNEWANMLVSANTQLSVSNVTFSLGSGISSWKLNNTAPDAIYQQYMDDGDGRTSVITMSGITYEKYRIIVYYSTDSENINFQPLLLNDVYYSATPAGATTTQYTIRGLNATWGSTGPSHSAHNPMEGVNALVTDVLTGSTATLKAIRPSGSSARATIAAIQIVKVGEIVEPTEPSEPFMLTIAAAKGLAALPWSTAGWMGENGVPVPAERWSESVGAAVINVSEDVAATLVADKAITVTQLTVNSTEELTLDKGSSSLAIGTLTVADGQWVAVGDGVTVTTPSVSAGGHIHYLGSTQVTSPKVTTAGAIVSYQNAKFTTAPSAYSWILRVEDEDAVTMSGAQQFFPVDVRGGTLTLGGATDVGEYIYGGKNGGGANTNSVITVNGGTVVANINGTATTGSSNRGFIYGGTTYGITQHPTLVINDGEFDISRGVLAPWEYSILTVNGGILKAKGICKGGGTSSSMNLNGGELIIGSLGISTRNGTMPITIGGDVKITATDDMSISLPTTINAGKTLELLAANGKTLTVATTVSGEGGIAVGATGADGTVKFTTAPTFTGAIVLNAGTLTLPFGSYANAITVAEGTTLNLTGELTGDEMTITTGTFTNHGTVKVNGGDIPQGWVLDGNKIRRLATKPFMFIIAGAQGDVNWTNANWVGQNGYAVLPTQWNEADVTAVIRGGAGDTARMVVDTPLTLSGLTIETAERVVLGRTGENTLAVATLSVANGYQVALESGVSVTAYDVAAGGKVYLNYPTTLSSGAAYLYLAGGAGSVSGSTTNTVGMTLNGGTLNLAGGTYHLNDNICSGTQTAVNIFDSEVNALKGDGRFAVGMADYVIGGSAVVNATAVILSQGNAGRTATMVLKDHARINVFGTSIVDSNKSSIMFGHWDGPSTFTLQDDAVFNAPGAEVLVGKTHNTQTINIAGGTLTAVGIKLSASATGTNRMNLNGGELRLGSSGITSYGTTTMPISVGGDAKITSTAAMSITQKMTIGLGHTLTFNAAAGDINAAAANIDNWGAVVVEAGTVNLGTCRGYIEVQGTANVKLYETINDGGEITIKVADSNNVTIVRSDGTTAIEDVKAKDNGDGTFTYSFTPQLDGKVCWWDYEFNGNADNTGTEGDGFSWDNDRPFKDNEYTNNALRVPTRPYRSVTWPTEDTTFVIYGKMVKNDNAYQLCFGTKGGNLIFLATGNVASNEVVLCYSNNNNPQVLKTMTVPNAQTANHLYAFTLKTVEGVSVIDIYLDGELLESYNAGTKVSLGGGFQIASPHGGTVSGYSRTSNDDPATIDFLRVYKCELSAAAMAAYAEQYPYVSPNGWYVREVEGGDVTWDADSQWTKFKPGEEASTTNQPAADATVGLVVDDDTTVTMNFKDDVTYEAMTLDGEGEVTITNATEATGQIKLTGRLTVNTDATIDARAIDVANTPVTIAEGKTLTIDMAREGLDELLQTTVIRLTGAATTGFGSDVAVRTGEIEEIEGRTFTVEPNANQHYEMTVEVVPEEVKLGMTIEEGEVKFGAKQIDIPLDWTLQLTNTTALTHGEVTKTTVASALNDEEVPNGIKPWESYVLTLSPTNALSKPTTLPVQASGTSAIVLRLGNTTVREAVKDQVNVGYKVIVSAEPGGTGTEVPVEDPSAAEVDLPTSGVKYYRYNIEITPKP